MEVETLVEGVEKDVAMVEVSEGVAVVDEAERAVFTGVAESGRGAPRIKRGFEVGEGDVGFVDV